MKKKFCELLYGVLAGTEGVLGFADARVRDSFLKILKDKTLEYQQAKNKLLTSLGKPIPEKKNFYSFTPEYLAELEILNNETIELPDQPRIKDFVALSSYCPKIGEAEQLDEALASLIKAPKTVAKPKKP